MRRILIPAVAALAVLGVTACSPSESDFASEGEKFIEDEDGDLVAAARTQYGDSFSFSDAACDEPASTDVGTEFACTALGSDGLTYNFAGVISGERSIEVGIVGPSDGGATTTTVAATPTGTADATATTAAG